MGHMPCNVRALRLHGVQTTHAGNEMRARWCKGWCKSSASKGIGRFVGLCVSAHPPLRTPPVPRRRTPLAVVTAERRSICSRTTLIFIHFGCLFNQNYTYCTRPHPYCNFQTRISYGLGPGACAHKAKLPGPEIRKGWRQLCLLSYG